MKEFFTLGDGVIITGTLGYGVMSDGVHGDGMGSGFGTLGDVCVLFSYSICVRNCGCSVGDVAWAAGAWRLIKLLAAIASRLRSLIYVSTFKFDMPLSECSRSRMDLTTQ